VIELDTDIKKLLDLLNIDDLTIAEYGTLEALEVDPAINAWMFFLAFERPIPILRYRHFMTKLLNLHDTIPSIKTVDFSIKMSTYNDDDLMDYYDYILDNLIEEDKRLLPLKNYPTTIEGESICIKVPQGSKSAQMFRTVIETDLKKHGFKALVEIRIDEECKSINEEIEKANRVFVKQAETLVYTTSPTKFIPLNDDRPVGHDFTPIKDLPFDEVEFEEFKNKYTKPFFTIKGMVSSIEIRQMRNGGQANIIMSDGTDSLLVKKRISNPEDVKFCNEIKEGNEIHVSGFGEYDKFYGEFAITATNMERSVEVVSKTSRIDLAKEKRVELHLHTKMSALDGVNTMEDYIRRAKDWHHSAIAVTDHASVQSFPDLFKLTKETGVKALYGLELVYADDEAITITEGKIDQMLNDATYVVFDIETTGLSVIYDTLIEIAGVKIKSGTVIDRFSTFINPMKPISEFTSELTGITNADVQNAPKLEEALQKFYEFSKDAILVAHNASFDLGHIYENYRRLNISSLIQPSIDTLMLAKVVFPDRQRYSLDQLCKFLKVPMNGHHRAINDAEATHEVFLHLLREVKKAGINRFQDLNLLIDPESVHRYPYPNHINMLVKKQEGLKNLYKILSIASTKYFDRDAKITKSFLNRHRKGILIGSGCRNSHFFEIAMNDSKESLRNAARFYDYLEVQPLSSFSYMSYQMPNWQAVLQDVIRRIVEIGKELNIPVCATGDVHHLDPEDKIFREIMIATPLVGGGGYHKLYNELEKPNQHYLTTEEMLNEFAFLGAETAKMIVIDNPVMISEEIDVIEIFGKDLYAPTDEFLAEQGVPSIKVKVETMVRAKAFELYGDPLPLIVKKRLEQELTSIIKHQFSTIYYISHLLVKKSLDDGYLVGSRGSVGSSLVATLMDITEVNPLPPHYICPKCHFSAFKKTDEDKKLGINEFEKQNDRLFERTESGLDLPDQNCPICGTMMKKDGHDIPFETFLGFKGDKVPDIDLNFSGDYQSVVHDYIRKIFGENYAFRAGTIGTCAAKTAFGMVRDFYKKINEERQSANLPPIRVRRAEMERLSKGIEGSKRTSGQHPGGIVVVPNNKEIFDVTPIQYPGDSSDTSWKTTHFDYHSFESNLFKLDVLGHDDPTMIRYLMDLVKKEPMEFPFAYAKDIPVDDKEVYRLLSGTEVINLTKEDIRSDVASFGVPEFGTNFVRGMLRDSKPSTFAELVKISGLSHGTDVWNSNAQDLIFGKKREFGRIDFKNIIGCRDDIMIDLIDYGMQPTIAFEIMEFVRKGKAPTNPDKWSTYADLMRQSNVPEWYIWSCSKIKYMFPKAHATAYVLMAMRIAWFKLYKPIYFYSAYFSKRAGIFDADVLTNGEYAIKLKLEQIEAEGNNASDRDKNLATVLELAYEMYKRGMTFSPINIHHSHATEFLISKDKKSLILPFIVVDSLGMNVANSIIEARNEKPFVSKQDVRNRTKLSKTLYERMDDLGAFGDLVEESQMSLFDF
jgi:DNA polymerase-3 subunit alpha (Gram-positive type)